MSISNLRCNEQIRISPIRLIDDSGEMRGVVSTDDALRMARDAGVDLVEVSPNERPPVCKLMDYGKHKYMQSKKLKQKHHERKTKEVRLRPKTDPHDRDIKMKRALRFLEEGDRVQFTMMFRGRERFHADVGYDAFNAIVKSLGELVKVERPPRLFGRRMTMVLAPSKPPKPEGKSAKAAGPGKPKKAHVEAPATPSPAGEAPQNASEPGDSAEKPMEESTAEA